MTNNPDTQTLRQLLHTLRNLQSQILDLHSEPLTPTGTLRYIDAKHSLTTAIRLATTALEAAEQPLPIIQASTPHPSESQEPEEQT